MCIMQVGVDCNRCCIEYLEFQLYPDITLFGEYIDL